MKQSLYTGQASQIGLMIARFFLLSRGLVGKNKTVGTLWQAAKSCQAGRSPNI